MSSRFITVLPGIAMLALLAGALGLVARTSPTSAGSPDTARQQRPGAECPVKAEDAVGSNRSHRHLLL